MILKKATTLILALSCAFLTAYAQQAVWGGENMGMPYTYRKSEGGHILKNWRVYLSEFLPLLFQ